MKNEVSPENKEIFVYGFKHIKTDKIDKFILFRCESDELFENDRLFDFWSNNFFKKEIEMRNSETRGWSFRSLVKRNNFFKIQKIVCS